MTYETQFPLLHLSLAAALEQVAGGSSFPASDSWILGLTAENTVLIQLTLESAASFQFMLPEIHCQTQSLITLVLHQETICSLSSNINCCQYLSSTFGGKANGPLCYLKPVYFNNLVPEQYIPSCTCKLRGNQSVS